MGPLAHSVPPSGAAQPNHSLNAADLVHAARHLGLKAKLTRTRSDRLALTPLPALALMHSAPHADVQQTADNRGDHGTSTPSLHVVIHAQSDGQRVLLDSTVAIAIKTEAACALSASAGWLGGSGFCSVSPGLRPPPFTCAKPTATQPP